jgi:hypothetical protein
MQRLDQNGVHFAIIENDEGILSEVISNASPTIHIHPIETTYLPSIGSNVTFDDVDYIILNEIFLCVTLLVSF